MKQELFDKMKQVSRDGGATPSNAVWERLERRLDADRKISARPPLAKVHRLFSFKRLSIAASVLVLIGAYGVLNHLGTNTAPTAAIHLEDLHTLQVNPRYNIAPVGESFTIPSVHMMRSIRTTYQGIDEGSADKSLIRRVMTNGTSKEFGLG